jgi:hypothetical protein
MFPDFSLRQADLPTFKPILQVIEIPQTRQTKRALLIKPPKPIIPVEGTDIELLSEVKISLHMSEHGTDSLFASDFIEGLPLPYKPRQIVEVIPGNVDKEITGEIILQLKIGLSGKVNNFRIIKNSTNSQTCLEEAISAAKKSLWEAAVMNGQTVEYWIEKIYRFNMD